MPGRADGEAPRIASATGCLVTRRKAAKGCERRDGRRCRREPQVSAICMSPNNPGKGAWSRNPNQTPAATAVPQGGGMAKFPVAGPATGLGGRGAGEAELRCLGERIASRRFGTFGMVSQCRACA
jgi:hypothetical protein